MQKVIWFTGGFIIGLTALSMSKASIPAHSMNDTAIEQRLSEINVKKEAKMDFDADITRLSKMEDDYHEKLPTQVNRSRIAGAMKRVSQQKYRYSGSKK